MSGVKSGVVITKKVQVGAHGLIVQMVEVCQFFYILSWMANWNAAVRIDIT